MTSAPRFALAALLAAALLGGPRFCAAAESSETAAPDGDPSARQPARLLECRGEATVQRTCDRLGLLPPLVSPFPESAPFNAFRLARDIHSFSLGPVFASPRPNVDFYAFSPGDRDAFFALFAAENWSREPDTPEGWQVFVPPSRSFTNYFADAGGKLVAAQDPADLQAAIDRFPALPPTLPAEGDILLQLSGPDVAAARHLTSPEAQTVADGLAAFTSGLGIDGDTAALQCVMTPVPGSRLAELAADRSPVPASTACVNLPGAIGFFAQGPEAPLGLGPSSSLAKTWALFTTTRPVAFALYPPPRPGALPRALAFLGFAENDDPDQTRQGFLSLFTHGKTFAIASSAHRDIPVDAISVADPAALAPRLTRYFGFPAPQATALAAVVSSPLASLAAATLPDGQIFALNDTDSSLLHAALDAVLDGGLPARQFDQSPAFRAAFPHPDAHAHALAHLDLDAIAPLLPLPLPFDLPSPCPVDLFSYVADDSSLVLRLRAPVPLVRTLATSALGDAAFSRAGGAGVQPPSLAPPPDAAPSAPHPTPHPATLPTI